ncbi:Maf family protein [Myxococcota bacterium]|nr:Maf family protein [Myxococcota bacterium]
MNPPARNCLILASASPRRSELLDREGIEFEIRPANIPEQQRRGEKATDFAERLAREKAIAVARRSGPAPDRRVLGADTIVVLDGEVFGKPRDPAHAIAMLTRLTGREHVVVTAIALVSSGTLKTRFTSVSTRVRMRNVAPEEIRAYVATGEPLDKAGAYAIQGEGRRLVESIQGSETNVIGLPVEETLKMLQDEDRPGTST